MPSTLSQITGTLGHLMDVAPFAISYMEKMIDRECSLMPKTTGRRLERSVTCVRPLKYCNLGCSTVNSGPRGRSPSSPVPLDSLPRVRHEEDLQFSSTLETFEAVRKVIESTSPPSPPQHERGPCSRPLVSKKHLGESWL